MFYNILQKPASTFVKVYDNEVLALKRKGTRFETTNTFRIEGLEALPDAHRGKLLSYHTNIAPSDEVSYEIWTLDGVIAGVSTEGEANKLVEALGAYLPVVYAIKVP